MKKLMVAFFAIFFFLMPLVASEETDKVYVKEENIFFDQGKIYLLIEGSYFEIHTLMSDQGGIYVPPKELKWPYTPFICPNCDTLNGPGARYCKKCGAPRPD
ncbi:MAG: zinc ribbon domain-containing protein [Chlamydiia bacterium]|nr:zinc ribbon domain-containing protein [Chlamydiia bacterium]